MNDNLSEMIGKHCHNEMQDEFPYGGVLPKKRRVMKSYLYILNLTPCYHYRSKEYASVAGYNVETKAS